jgi:CheY-like chemotaxis protein
MTGNAAPQRATILIVDDEPYNVDYLQQLLSDLGFRTREAFGGKDALDSVADDRPDLILLDVMMPDIDGITVCRMLKGDPATRLIPIVIMTALDGTEDRIRGIEAGADDFLTKPVDDRELLARINAALRTKRAVDETVVELASAAEQLVGMGSWREESAVVAVELRSGGAPVSDSPDAAHDYLVSRYRTAVRDVLEQFGGQLMALDADIELAVLRVSGGGPNPAVAVEAAMAVRAQVEALNRTNEVEPLYPAISVHMGEVSVEPRRVSRDGDTRWTLGTTGVVCDQALLMVAEAGGGEILASTAVLDQLRGRYHTEPVETSSQVLRAVAPQRVLAAASDGEQATVTQADEAPHHQVRVLTTIFVSDLVGSTEIAVQLGDRAWTEALDGHYRLVRSTFAQFDGEEISTSGDGFLALFDGPAKAIRAGLTIADLSGAAGLPVRVGIHTGELERTGASEVQGIAVHLAARVSAEAGSGQVFVTSTTKDAVAGAGLGFESIGERVMKGIDGPRAVYLALPD